MGKALNTASAVHYLLGFLCVISLIGIVFTEVIRSGKIIYFPGQKRKRSTIVQIVLVGIFAASGLALLLLT